jgi:hypothetical protein
MVFSYMASFPGHNHGLPIPDYLKDQGTLGARVDKDGNILPNNIRRYSFEDEYTYRV